ncbi:hypothetical protein GCM10010411_11940 [Actinomadura fulvescens]|uniref:Membrane-associated oxidoreductase n=1 Tax=Actinomadura fulvescens TaxID=46160 RepID=A0ABN3PDW7_9ACTN
MVDLLLAPPERPGPFRLRGAHITGALDLEACTLDRPLAFEDCVFEEAPNFDEVTAPALRLPGCRVPGLSAQQLRTTGNVELNKGFVAEGVVDLLGAHIGGKLSLTGSRLSNAGGVALNADRLIVEQGMFCWEGFVAEGEMRLLGARIDGQLSLSGARLSNPGGNALMANWLSVAQYMLCKNGFSAEGRVSLAGAKVGHLDLSTAVLRNPGGPALNGSSLTVEQDLVCAFESAGEVQLAGAKIGGNLVLDGARLTNPGRSALRADGLVVERSLFCRGGFAAEGELRLIGARVGGVCDLTGARLANPGGRALYAIRLEVGGDLMCRNGFAAAGEIRLNGAHVGGQLEFTGATLSHPGGHALGGLGMTVDQHLFFRDGFVAEGELYLTGTRVGGRLSFIDAELSNPRGHAVSLEAVRARALVMRFGRAPAGTIDLTNVQVESLRDDAESWPASRVTLRGFAFDRLEHDEIDVRTRLRRLARHPDGYVPQPYDQLAAAYRRDGREEAARRVAIAKHWHRRKVLGPFGRLANWMLYLTVGYGYRTWLAAVWLAGLLALGSLVFARAEMGRADPKGPAFHAFAYTLDVLLPIVDLGQQKAWNPGGAAVYWSWALIAAGWILTTAVVAGLTGIIKRD